MDKERLDEQRLEEDVFNISFKISKKKAIALMLSAALIVASIPLTVGAATVRRNNINSTGVFEYKEAGTTEVRIDSADLLYMADEVDDVDESLSDIEDDVTTLENAITDITAYGKGNATSSDLVSGKTAWVNGSMITGSMTNNGALSKSFTPSTSSQSYTIPAGYTSGGTVTCAAIPNQRTASSETISSAKTYSAGYYPNNWTVTPATASLGTKTITPSTSTQTVYASSSGYDGFSYVTVSGVSGTSSAIPASAAGRSQYDMGGAYRYVNLSNMTSGCSHSFGTTTITPSTSSQTVYASTYGYSGFSSVTVGAAASQSPSGTYTISTTGTTASAFSSIDMGTSSWKRYVDASSVFTQGYNQFPKDHSISNVKYGSFSWARTSSQTVVSDVGFKPDVLVLFSTASNKYIGVYDSSQSSSQARRAGSGSAVAQYNLGTSTDQNIYSIDSNGFTMNKPSTEGVGTVYYIAIKKL